MQRFDIYEREFLDTLLVDNDAKSANCFIGKYIHENYKKVCFMDLNELSETLSIDTSIISEFLNSIGFSSYESFRKHLRKIVTVNLTTTDRFQISKEINTKVNSILNVVINKEINNLNSLIRGFDEESIIKIIESVINAPEIIVVGTRSSKILAIYTEYIFNRIGKKTTKITSGCSENFDFFATINRDALVISFGFARYPKETIQIMNFLKKRNFKIISFTDNNLSPLVPLSEISISIPCESVSFTDFFSVPTSLINTIAISVSHIDETTTLSNLHNFETIAKDANFYF